MKLENVYWNDLETYFYDWSWLKHLNLSGCVSPVFMIVMYLFYIHAYTMKQELWTLKELLRLLL